jgi:hypothetical protein
MPIEGLDTRTFSIDEVAKQPIEITCDEGRFANPYTIADFDSDLEHCLEYGRYLAEEALPPFLNDHIIAGGIFTRMLNNEYFGGGDIDVWPFAGVGVYAAGEYGRKTVDYLYTLYDYFFNEKYVSSVTFKEILEEQLVKVLGRTGNPMDSSSAMGLSFAVNDCHPIDTVNLVLHSTLVKWSEESTLKSFDYAHTQIAYNPTTDKIITTPLAMCCAKHKVLARTKGASNQFRRQQFLTRGFIL